MASDALGGSCSGSTISSDRVAFSQDEETEGGLILDQAVLLQLGRRMVGKFVAGVVDHGQGNGSNARVVAF